MAILIVLIIIIIGLIFINIRVYCMSYTNDIKDISLTSGGYGGKSNWQNCKVGKLSFITPGNLLKNHELYVLVVDDKRLTPPDLENIKSKGEAAYTIDCDMWKLKTLHWKTPGKKWNNVGGNDENGNGGMMQCFEILQPPEGKPILTDLLMYNNEDIRFLPFSKRLEYLNLICKVVKLDPPKYEKFYNNRHFGSQFEKFGLSDKTKEMIFKDPKHKYFHPKATQVWVNPNILTLCAYWEDKMVKFIDNEQLKSLDNDEFPMMFENLENKKDGPILIYISCDEITAVSVDGTNDKHADVMNIRDASSVWRTMNKGMSADSFLGNDLSIMKKLHRSMEYPLIFSNIPDNSTILDIGAGRGANIMHWKQKHFEVYAVEPNKDNYNILEKKINIYHNIKFLNAYGQESDKILGFLDGKKMDAIIMVYSLTFFFETEKILNNFVELIDLSLKPGGLFLGTVMDGNRLMDAVNKDGVFDCPPFTIRVASPPLDPPLRLKRSKKKKNTKKGKKEQRNVSSGSDEHISGSKIRKVFINIDDKVSLVKNQTEYLVDFKLLQKKLEKKKIYLEKTGFVGDSASGDHDILNDCPKKFTRMMRWFVFKKN